MNALPKVCFITGCASGIGKQLSVDAYKRGYLLVVTDININALHALANEQQWDSQRAICLCLDVRNLDHWEKAMEAAIIQFGRIDILMNVAGVLMGGFVYEPCSTQEVELHININIKGLMYGCYTATKYMVTQQSGHIINISSLAGIAPVPGLSVYTASKYAVRGYSLAIASELREKNVFVSVVCPDAVETPMLERQIDMPQAVLAFSAKPLQVAQVVGLIFDHVIPKRPLEAMLPKARGFISKLTMVFPILAIWIKKPFVNAGRKAQLRLQQSKLQQKEH